MSGANRELPRGFEALEPFVATWAVASAANRARLRLESTETERSTFFNAAKDLVGPALTYLDRKRLDQFDDRERRLMNLMLSVAHVTLAIEVQGEDEPKHALGRRHITITRAPSDFG
jgi:hypothetical protein